MHDKKIIEYAIKGLSSDIVKSELTIYKCSNYIKDLECGKKINSPKTIYELNELINKHNKIINELNSEKESLLWVLATEY